MTQRGFVDDTATETLADGFRALMSTFPTGVVVVTATGAGGEPWGMTCSSLCSVTLRPPTLLVCLRASSPTLKAVRERGTFSVNLLRSGAEPTARLFASGASDRFDRVRWREGGRFRDPHLVGDAHAVAECSVVQAQPVGDHVVVLGEVAALASAGGDPLLYGMRRYAAWPGS